MKKLTFIFVLICIVPMSVSATQGVFQWFGAYSSNWGDGANWLNEMTGQFGDIPGSNDKAKINNVLWSNIFFPIVGGENGTQNISIGDVFMVDAGNLSPETLTIAQGGTFHVIGAGGTAQGQLNIAYAPGGNAIVNIYGGTAAVDGAVHVGWGGTGRLNLNNGTMTVNSIDFGGNGGTGWLRMNGYSQLIIKNGIVPPIGEPWPSIIDPESDEITITYDEVTGWTTLSTPEPASIALLGLGLTFLRKRK